MLKGAAALATGRGGGGAMPKSLAYLASSDGEWRVGQQGWLEAAFARRTRSLVQAAIEQLQQHPASGANLAASLHQPCRRLC